MDGRHRHGHARGGSPAGHVPRGPGRTWSTRRRDGC